MTVNDARIKVLPPGEAKRIAAGEVIDRPAALIREFLDNAIDAGAANIEVTIEEGGSKKAEAADDGAGMTREDLELCSLTHATSKIRGLDDLETANTLGFRGEALAAASAVARLEIISSTDGREAWRLEAGPGENYPPKLEQTRRTKGSTVRALNLFDSVPARKRFLKREGSEGALCRQAFIDKALAFPAINFRFIQDGKLKVFLPAVNSKKERFAAALLQTGEETYLHEINVTGNGFNAAIVISGPELYRNDRRQLFVFANGRRINDYALVQAMEYGAQGWFPNGTHPVGAVYIEIDPALADFNIHPAKREARFRDAGAIHHSISGGLRNFFHLRFIQNSSHGDTETSNQRFARHRGEDLNLFSANTYSSDTHNPSNQNIKNIYETIQYKKEGNNLSSNGNISASSYSEGIRCLRVRSLENKSLENSPHYVGRLFNLFILIEWGDRLYIIDQHAAHERILFDRFLKEPIPRQELLAPIPFTTESDDDDSFLETKREELSRLGVIIEKDGASSGSQGWRIDALPADWRLSDAATVKEILELKTAGESMAERWAATLCCHSAIKDGDYPDDETAFSLGIQALNLPDPRCPHGRPVWTEIGKDALYKAVRRE